MTMSLQASGRLEGAGKTGSARCQELLLLCCQVTRAQHAAKAGTLRLALRRALRPGVEPVPGGKLVQRFMKVDFHGSKSVSVLRLSIALQELLDVEAAGRSDVDPGGADQARMCASRGLDALRKLGPDYFSVDAGLLVRSAAWLSAHCALAPEVRQLLDVPQVMAVLHRDYGKSLKAYFANREDALAAELVARLGAETVEPSASLEAGTLTKDQQAAIGAACGSSSRRAPQRKAPTSTSGRWSQSSSVGAIPRDTGANQPAGASSPRCSAIVCRQARATSVPFLTKCCLKNAR
jgi:hypothetical protein